MRRGCRAEGRGGFGLIELLVGISMLAVLLALAVPAFGEWVRNARLRSAAESLRADLQMARAEAIRRNAATRLQFVSSLDADCALQTTGPAWVVTLGAAQSPAGACGNVLSSITAPYLLAKSPVVTTGSADWVLTASRSVVGFDAMGRQSATTNPTHEIDELVVQLGSASHNCVAAGGDVRCLKVIVSPGGTARICDPARTDTPDPMNC